MRPQFSLIAFQDRLIERLASIDANGVGGHKPRSRSRAMRNARAELVRRGYTETQAAYAVGQARDVYDLERLAAVE